MSSTGPQDHTQMLLLLVLVLVFGFLMVVFVGLLYVAHQHPSLSTPLVVAMTGVALVVGILAFVIALR
ncbi:hypothetical protein [Streptomyces sp. NBC_01429]|uniref:hypothetical protein n=1 Tax=Streptomyces sp. NBC_01429 TaxID=2903862 RepID=UPI002E2BB859|nr:hypothetical protein [Streptomyces sp. NBC_01429]